MKRVLTFSLCLLLLLATFTFPGKADTVCDAQSVTDGIVAYYKSACEASSVQEWIDISLSEGAGTSSEWFVITLGQMGDYDFSLYRQNLLNYIEKNNPTSKVTLQKYALALLSSGYRSEEFVKNVADTSIGKQGIMSWIYGLHLLNNGIASSAYTTDQVVDTLLSKQFEDGGWALTGNAGNIDVTAMAVQALAPHAEANENVKNALERAVTLMASLQLENGSYQSYGVANPESAAQVICALSSMGIDYRYDPRFIKNGNDLMDGILPFRLEDGRFSHTLNGPANDMAAVQVMYALLSHQRMLAGQDPFYIFTLKTATVTEPAQTGAYSKEAFSHLNYKVITYIASSVLFVIGCILLLVLKKTSKKNFIALFIFCAAVSLAVTFINIETASDYYTNEPPVKENPVGTVTMTVRCDTVSGKTDLDHIPKDGVILPETVFEFEEGDTAYRILTDAARAYGLHIEKSGAPGMIYVTGINYLYEFDFGDLSGWNYFVNGETLSIGCDQYFLKDGDRIEWLYTLELGNDLR